MLLHQDVGYWVAYRLGELGRQSGGGPPLISLLQRGVQRLSHGPQKCVGIAALAVCPSQFLLGERWRARGMPRLAALGQAQQA